MINGHPSGWPSLFVPLSPLVLSGHTCPAPNKSLNASKKYLRYNEGVIGCCPSFPKGIMATPLTLSPLSDTQVTELRQLYDMTTKAKLRLRAQIVLLAHQGRSVADIAPVVFRSRDTV